MLRGARALGAIIRKTFHSLIVSLCPATVVRGANSQQNPLSNVELVGQMVLGAIPEEDDSIGGERPCVLQSN